MAFLRPACFIFVLAVPALARADYIEPTPDPRNIYGRDPARLHPNSPGLIAGGIVLATVSFPFALVSSLVFLGGLTASPCDGRELCFIDTQSLLVPSGITFLISGVAFLGGFAMFEIGSQTVSDEKRTTVWLTPSGVVGRF